MKKTILTLLMATVLLGTGCGPSTDVKKDPHAGHSNTNSAAQPPADFSVEFISEPHQIKAGQQTQMVFTVKNAKGETVKDLQIVHEKPMHLLIVSDDLAEFYHEHPEAQADGSFKVPFTFKNGGRFKVYTDFTPPGAQQTVKSFTIDVTGNERQRQALTIDAKLEKTVDDLFVTMKPDKFSSGKELMLDFQVFDAQTKKPVTDLQNYLGAKAHFVIISQDLRDFVHAHPMSRDNVKMGEHHHAGNAKHNEKLAGVEAESIVSAHLEFPLPGIYKIFAQFQRNGKVTTVPFTVDVTDRGDSSDQTKTVEVEVPKDAYKIIVNQDGFVPGEVQLKKGNFTKLAFVRMDKENCADEIVFKSLNLRKKLPVGEVVLVDLPKDFSGELTFACGMDMYKGKLTVE